MTHPTSLSAVLKRYRLATGLSQEGLAARAGLSARAISDIERGVHHAPHSSTLDCLATGLALSSQQRAVLLAAARPELAAAAEAPVVAVAVAQQLPLPPNALIGRERECAWALAQLRDGQARLLTVTGPSGVGKTRLGLHIARELAPAFADGAVYVALAPLREAARVPDVLAQALGLRAAAGSPLADQLCSWLRDKRLLLVLDNFEHLLEAAPFVADLLEQCPQLCALVTSRTPLRVRAEQTLPLAPLALEQAVALFRERARAVRPDGVYAVMDAATICLRVDCLPLAIELAAVQVRVLSLPQLSEQLAQRLPLLRGGARDLPARQRTMEDAIGWSYDLLTEPQQRCMRALGVFVGGWTLEAARAIGWAEGDMAPHEVLLTIAALVDASLVQAEVPAGGAARFSMLELVREYALERQRAAGEAESCRRRHATYYARLAEAAMTLRPAAGSASGPLTLELPNARAALEWAEERQDAALGLRLAGFARLWHIRGQLDEAISWQERMLALDQRARAQSAPTAAPALRIQHLYGIARVLLGGGEMARAETFATEALHLAQQVGDESGISNACATLGLIAQASGKRDEAAAAFAESYAHARQSEQRGLRTTSLFHLAELARLQGDIARAGALLEEALECARADGNTWDAAMVTVMLGQVAHQQRRYAHALARYREGLALLRPFGSPTYSAWCLEGVAATLCAEEHGAPAVRLCAAAAALREQAHTPLPPAERPAFQQSLATGRALLGEERFAAEWAAGAALTQEAAIAEALALRLRDRVRDLARNSSGAAGAPRAIRRVSGT